MRDAGRYTERLEEASRECGRNDNEESERGRELPAPIDEVSSSHQVAGEQADERNAREKGDHNLHSGAPGFPVEVRKGEALRLCFQGSCRGCASGRGQEFGLKAMRIDTGESCNLYSVSPSLFLL